MPALMLLAALVLGLAACGGLTTDKTASLGGSDASAASAILDQPVWNGMYGRNVGDYSYHPVWNLQFQ